MPFAASPFVGIALKIISVMVFTVMGMLIKLVGQRFPTGEIVFFRSVFALVPLAIFLAWIGEFRSALRTSRLTGHFLRGGIGVFAMALNFAGIALLPLADATAIFYAAPIFVVVFAAVFLKERVRPYRWVAAVIGFGGVLLTLIPHLGDGPVTTGRGLGAMLTLLAALIAAFAMIQVRRLTETERTGSIVLYFTLFSSGFGLLSAVIGPVVGMPWAAPSALDLAILVAIGFLGGIAQICLTQSYRLGDASLIAPFEYASILFAITLGFVVFGDVPGVPVLVGAVLVVLSGIAVILMERRLARTSAGRLELASTRRRPPG